MMGDMDWRFPGTPGTTIRFQEGRQEDYNGVQGLSDFSGPPAPPAPPFCSQVQEGKQEEILMEHRPGDFPGLQAPVSASQATRRETAGD